MDFVRNNRNENTWLPSEHTVICSDHFKNEDKYLTKTRRVYVTKSAVPYDGSDSKSVSLELEEPMFEPGQSSHGADDSSLGSGHDEDTFSSTDNPISDDEEEGNLVIAELPGMSETEDQTAKGTSKKRKLEPEVIPPPPAKKICGDICSECSKEITKRVSWCIQCDVLLCMECEHSHVEHYVLRAPPNRPAGELEHVMSAIRPIVQHIVEATKPPDVSIELNTDPLLMPKEEPDDEEISFEIEVTPTQFINPNIVNYQMFSSTHTVTSATQSSQPMTMSQTVTSAPASQSVTLSHPVTPAQAHSSSSQVPSRMYLPTLKQKQAISERVKPKKSIEISQEKSSTVSDLEMTHTFETAPSSLTMSQTIAPSSSTRETERGETSTKGSIDKSGVINEKSEDVAPEPDIIKKENTDVSEFLVFSHNIKTEPDDPS